MSFVEKFVRVVSPVVLFYLMFCFAATIHPKQFSEKLKSKGIILGVFLQLFVMPFVGFILLKTVELSGPSQIVFMVVLSSPGGAFSNFLISIFNGDLALSIAMTTVSTMFSIVLLPFNLYFYLDLLGTDDDETGGAAASIDYEVLGRIVLILVSGVGLGLFANRRVRNREKTFYKIANIAAALQIVLALLVGNSDSPFYEKPPEIFLITFLAVIVALGLATAGALLARVDRPETFSIVVEVAVQNSSVAVAFAAAAFQGAELSESISVPVLHGIYTTFLALIFAFWAHYAGWTYAPDDVGLCTALGGYYQPAFVEGGAQFLHQDEETKSVQALAGQNATPEKEEEVEEVKQPEGEGKPVADSFNYNV